MFAGLSAGVMKKALLSLAVLVSSPAAFGSPDCGAEPACVLETLWPADAQASAQDWRALGLIFVEAAQAAGDDDVTWSWVERTGWTPAPIDQPFGTARAKDALSTLTPSQLREAWMDRRAPWFNVARSDVMLSVFRQTEDETLRDMLLADMLTLANPSDPDREFEGREFADVIALIGLETCDAGLVRDGAALSGEPNLVKFKVWEAHVAGRALDVEALAVTMDGDFDLIRAATDAYGRAWTSGPCNGGVGG